MKAKYGDDFEYELSCDQMCGKGHFSMRGVIVVESQAEYNVWKCQTGAAICTGQWWRCTTAPAPVKDTTVKSEPVALNN
jgi:cytochrome c oxidase subunit 2